MGSPEDRFKGMFGPKLDEAEELFGKVKQWMAAPDREDKARTAEGKRLLAEMDKQVKQKAEVIEGAHTWIDLLCTCLKVDDEDTQRAVAAAKIRTDGRHMTPAERLRKVAEFGQRVARDVPIDAVTDFSTFMNALTDAIKATGKLAGVTTALFEGSKESFDIGIEPLHRAAMWARAGFNELQLSDGLTAALLLTDVPHVEPDELRLPFECFAVRLPQGLIPFFVPDAEGSRREWCELMWVARYSNKYGTRIRLWVDWRGLTVARDYEEDWKTTHDAGEELANEDDIALDACFRLLRNFLLWLNDKGGLKSQRPESVPKKLQEKRGRTGEMWPTQWMFGREVTLLPELRRAAMEMALGRSHRHAVDGWKVRARFCVRGHWKNQAHGPGRMLRRRQWIAPFWKGPETGEAFAHIYRDPKVDP